MTDERVTGDVTHAIPVVSSAFPQSAMTPYPAVMTPLESAGLKLAS